MVLEDVGLDLVVEIGAGLEQEQHLGVLLDLALPGVDGGDRQELRAGDQLALHQPTGEGLRFLRRSGGRQDHAVNLSFRHSSTSIPGRTVSRPGMLID